MGLFVTDTAIIDVRNGDIIQAGQPFPKEAMHENTFNVLSKKRPPEILPFSPENVCILNPRLVNRHQVFSSMGAREMPRQEPKNVRDLISVLPDDQEQVKETGPTKLVVGMPETKDVDSPPSEVPDATPQSMSNSTPSETKAPPANIWVYDPATLEGHEIPELQATLVQRCQQFELSIPTITDKAELVQFLSSDYVAPKSAE